MEPTPTVQAVEVISRRGDRVEVVVFKTCRDVSLEDQEIEDRMMIR